MHIRVDAGACRALIKDSLFRMADRRQPGVMPVASQWVRAPQIPAGPVASSQAGRQRRADAPERERTRRGSSSPSG